MTWELHPAGSWGIATTDTPADMAAALALPGSWPIGAQPKCFVRRDQWANLAPPPFQLYSITPNVGPVAGGTVSVIAGGALTGATQVFYGGNAAAEFTVDSPTQITATSPAAPLLQPGNVNVNVMRGVASNSVQFDYQ